MPNEKQRRDCLDELREIELRLTASIPETAMILYNIKDATEQMIAAEASCKKIREENEIERAMYNELQTIWRLGWHVNGIFLAEATVNFQAVHDMFVLREEQCMILEEKVKALQEALDAKDLHIHTLQALLDKEQNTLTGSFEGNIRTLSDKGYDVKQNTNAIKKPRRKKQE
jgi:hypothetical protein